MPSYSFTVNAGESISSVRNKSFGTLAENEYIISLQSSSTVSETDKGKYTVPAASYGNIEIYLYGTYTFEEIGNCRKSAASPIDSKYTLLRQVSKFDDSDKINSFGKTIRIAVLRYEWHGTVPTSVTSFEYTLNTAYAHHSYSIGEFEHGSVVKNHREGYIPEGMAVKLTPYPDTGYMFAGWISSPQITITNNSFVMPDYDVTITPIFVPKNAGHYNGDCYDPCIPMYYDGTNWIECDWKYYDGTNWNDGESI